MGFLEEVTMFSNMLFQRSQMKADVINVPVGKIMFIIIQVTSIALQDCIHDISIRTPVSAIYMNNIGIRGMLVLMLPQKIAKSK